jgi:hypothetical protein
MDRHPRRLVDDNHVVVLVNDADGSGRDGGLVSVRGVGYEVAVLEDVMRTHGLAVDSDLAGHHGCAVVFKWPVAELVLKDVDQLPSSPSFLAVRVVRVEVGRDAA